MKYIKYTIIIIITCFTIFCTWMYFQRASFTYTDEGTFFSVEEGVVYHEQTKEFYGIVSVLGLFLLGIVIYRLIKR